MLFANGCLQTRKSNVVADPEKAETDQWDDKAREIADNDGPEPGEECGRWSNGRLTRYCAKAGSEECEFECPYRR